MTADEAMALARAELARFGEWENAKSILRAILAYDPGHHQAMGMLGALLVHTGPETLDEGGALIRRAIETAPDRAAVARVVGDTFLGQGAFDNAGNAFGIALHFAPGDLAAARRLELVRLGGAPLSGREDAAQSLGPDELLILGQGILFGDDRPGDAATVLGALLAREPGSVQGLRLMAMARNLEGRPAEALELALEARRLENAADPHPAFETDIANYAMGAARLDLAWDFLEARLKPGWNRTMTPRRDFPMPRWQGEDIAGRTILVWREDGLGDEMIFSSTLPDLAALGARVVYECHPRLLSIYRRSFAEMTVRPAPLTANEAVDYSGIDFHVALESLFAHFRKTLADFPKHPHLHPDPVLAARWKDRLDALGPGRKIGIGWKSGKNNPLRDRYYSRLSEWEPLLRLPDTVFVNLQYGDCEAELEEAQSAFGVRIHRWDDLDLWNDFEAQMALIANLDWVVSAPTTPLMLSGAVGARSLLVSTLPNPKALGQSAYPWYRDTRCLYRPYDQTDRRPLLARAAAMIEAEP